MSRLGFLVLLLIIYLGFDIYTFYGLSSLITAQSFFCPIYWAISAIVFSGFYKVSQDLQRFKGGDPSTLGIMSRRDATHTLNYLNNA